MVKIDKILKSGDKKMKEDKQELDFYGKHGMISDPKSYYHILDHRPFSIEKTCENIFSIIVNDLLYNMHCVNISGSFKEDINVRSVAGKLEIVDQRIKSQSEGVKNECNSLGNCRDLSLIICASFRQKAIPSRVRSGFATFFNPIKKFDHWICEFWNQEEKHWQRIDPWMYQIKQAINRLPKECSEGFSVLNLDPLNLDSVFFLTGAEAWERCRNNVDDFNNFGTYEVGLEGEWFVRDNMIRDLFCLNKIEPLPWDCWGAMGKQNNDIDETGYLLLDKVASILSSDNVSLKTLTELSLQLGEAGIPDKWELQ